MRQIRRNARQEGVVSEAVHSCIICVIRRQEWEEGLICLYNSLLGEGNAGLQREGTEGGRGTGVTGDEDLTTAEATGVVWLLNGGGV